MKRFGFVVAVLVGCGQVQAPITIDAPSDGAPDVPPADAALMCDPMAKFDVPVPILGLPMPGVAAEHAPRLSQDELTIYFSGLLSGGTDVNLYVAHRKSRDDNFDQPTPLAVVNSSAVDIFPTVTSDELTLWFASNRVPSEPNHLYIATRASVQADFGQPGLAAIVNASTPTQVDTEPFAIGNGQELWFASNRPMAGGAFHIWRSTRSGNDFTAPMMVSELTTTTEERAPVLSADRQTIYFASGNNAPGAKGGLDIWRSHRSSTLASFPAPTLVDELSSTGNDYPAWLSADNCRLYGYSGDNGANSFIFRATRKP